MGWLRARMTEPSSLAAIAAMVQVLKVFFPAYSDVIDGVTATAGSLAVVRKG